MTLSQGNCAECRILIVIMLYVHMLYRGALKIFVKYSDKSFIKLVEATLKFVKYG
jgi:hypothetical protein